MTYFNGSMMSNINNIYNNNYSQSNTMMIQFKPITNSSQISDINDTSFINSTLQALASINCFNMWIQNLQYNQNLSNNFPNLKITKELFNLFSSIYSGAFPDSTDLILNYFNKVKMIHKEKIENSIEFLYYLIQLIHYENNCPPNPNQNMNSINNLPIIQKMDDEFVRNFFFTLLKQTHNSIISQNFYNIIRQEIICSNCPTKYSYYFKYMIKFNVSDYIKYRNEFNPGKSSFRLTLDDCFTCYTGGYPYKCEACGNTKANTYNSFCIFPKVLLIALIRTKHNYCCDVDFTNNLNVNAYYIKGINNNMNYTLKACISLNVQGNYFSYININNIWYKYFGKQFSPLSYNNNDIKMFEPQILIYESQEKMFNSINNNIPQMQMSGNFNMSGIYTNMNFMPNMNFGYNFP